jgi:hypothetical protein
MTYHAGIHPTVPPLIQSFERIGLMAHALGSVRDIDLTKYAWRGSSWTVAQLNQGSWAVVLRSAAGLSTPLFQYYSVPRTIARRSAEASPTVKALLLPTR